MKKLILILLFFTGFLQAQTLQNPTYGNTTTNTLKIKTPATIASVNFLPAFDVDGITLSKIAPINITIPYIPVNYTASSSSIGSHLSGIDTRLGQKVNVSGDSMTGNLAFTAGTGSIFQPAVLGTNRTGILFNASPNNNYAQLMYYPTSGTNVGNLLAISPKGTGFTPGIKSQIVVYGTDFVNDPTNYEYVALRANTNAFVLSTGKAGTGTLRPLLLSSGYGDISTNPDQFWLQTSGGVSLGNNTDPGSGNMTINGRLGIGTVQSIGRFNVNTGTSGNTMDLINQANGTFSFVNNGASTAIPTIIGKSNDSSAITFIAGTNNANSAPDFSVNTRQNNNTDYTTLTTSTFRISRFGTILMDMLRNGNTTFSGTVSAPAPVNGSDLTNKTYVDNANALKANDADVVKTSGNQTKSGYLYTNSSGGFGFIADNTNVNSSDPVIIRKSGKMAFMLNTNGGTQRYAIFDGSLITGSDKTYAFPNQSGNISISLDVSATLDFPTTPGQTSSELTITVTGAADGDPVSLGVGNSAAVANGAYSCRVSAVNTVTVKFNNYGLLAIDPPSGTFKVKVFK